MKECSECCEKHKTTCPIKNCKYWINYKKDYNCTLIAVDRNGQMTLREIAERLNISFVRVKQLQDRAIKKLALVNDDMKKYLEFVNKGN